MLNPRFKKSALTAYSGWAVLTAIGGILYIAHPALPFDSETGAWLEFLCLAALAWVYASLGWLLLVAPLFTVLKKPGPLANWGFGMIIGALGGIGLTFAVGLLIASLDGRFPMGAAAIGGAISGISGSLLLRRPDETPAHGPLL